MVGGLSTFLAVIPLAFSTSAIIGTVFTAFFSMVTLGVAHGLVFLPVVLSLVGPTMTPRLHDDQRRSVDETRPESQTNTDGEEIMPPQDTCSDQSISDDQLKVDSHSSTDGQDLSPFLVESRTDKTSFDDDDSPETPLSTGVTQTTSDVEATPETQSSADRGDSDLGLIEV